MLIMCDQTMRDKLAVTWHIARIGDKVDLKLSLTAPLIYQVPNLCWRKKYFISSQTAAFVRKRFLKKWFIKHIIFQNFSMCKLFCFWDIDKWLEVAVDDLESQQVYRNNSILKLEVFAARETILRVAEVKHLNYTYFQLLSTGF